MSEECEVTVVESGGPDNGANFWAGVFSIGEIDATSVKDMVDKLIAHADKKGCCIKKLTICGHGSPGNVSVGDGQGHESGKHMDGNEAEWGPELDRLKPKLCPGAVVILRSCNTAAEQAGADKLFDLAKRLGCTVRGYTGTIYPGPIPDGTGEWLEATPTHKPPVRPVPAGSKKKKKKKGAAEHRVARIQNIGLPYRSARGPAVLRFEALNGARVAGRINRKASFALSRADVKALAAAVADYEPIIGQGAAFDIEAEVQVEGAPASYLVGGASYLIPGGDWAIAYPVGPLLRQRLWRVLAPPRKRSSKPSGRARR
jgi:hypothetical protein